MDAWWLALTGAGVLVLGLSVHGARTPRIGPREVRVFQVVNRLPDGLYRVLWAPMQLGNLVVGTLAVGATLAALSKLVGERLVRRRMAAYLAVRQRPGTSQPGARLRGRDVPTSGPSFPSGHAILVAAVGAAVAPYLGPAWWWLLLVATLLVMVGRVYVGAHNPLDVTAGAGAGLVLGGLLASLTL